MHNTRILIADNHTLLRNIIVSRLVKTPGFIIAGEVNNGRELINKYFKLKPDIILTDVSLPLLSGIEAVKTIRRSDPAAKALFMSMFDGDEYIYEALISGGRGLVNKSIFKDELISAIEKINLGGTYFGPGYDQNKLNMILKKYSSGICTEAERKICLSQSEAEFLRLLCDALSSQEIAEKLSISRQTIEALRGHMMLKLKVYSFSQLIRQAVLNRILRC